MAALSDDVKRFIVQALACFETPSEVAEAVKQEFGLTVSRQQIETYDPGRCAGRALSAKWRELFEATRTQMRNEVIEIPIANRITRLRALQHLLYQAQRMKNYVLAMQILEQAAKEVGGMYESRRHRAGSVGTGDEPVATQVIRSVQSALSPDEPVPERPIL
ncbi:DUF2280 domain-containing protein [Paucibacter sp. R3-3]|uniref:DUF2280 domain-containing protein n=1 Tax=Roseateles agri TaxID=3098619 RepID=A0ABU5DJV9_9BURK|nr:DUF2280 domain-containing protein [Paucibacter sp. R3-3]MDY0746571.1 DUF2280 domain-containing protein [Paucibacter sp. R3-3]